MDGGFIPVVPELIKSNGDDYYLHVDLPGNDTLNFLLLTQNGCPACDKIAKTLLRMQQDPDLYFPAIVYYLDISPRGPDDVNHAIAMHGLNVENVPALFIVNKKKRLIPFPMIGADGTRVPHLVNLTQQDIYQTWCR